MLFFILFLYFRISQSISHPMDKFKRYNNITGWIVFFISSLVYILTSEPTTSFWDCGEYISTAYKLQVGHPPGAPFFQLMGRIFSMFAFGDTSLVARMVNTMSALSSSFTVLFLFWSITHLTRKLFRESSRATMLAALGSGVVGAFAYTFSDSFWFSAVEGEVYAMSSLFTAVVFWAILKWENEAEDPRSSRWIVLIAFLIGLSIGVHLLNLLAIPAIAFVYYFKKYKTTTKGILLTGLISVFLLFLVMSVIVPGVVYLSGLAELLFVNGFGLPFHTGTLFYFALIAFLIVWGIRSSHARKRVAMNTAILCITFILIGYSSFLLLIIRSNANTPINENHPRDAISLLAYLNREQYGDWPIVHGQYYNAPVIERNDGRPVYRKDQEKGRYVITDDRERTVPVYDPRFTTIFPRMWNNTENRYIRDYETWGKIEGIPVTVGEETGEPEVIRKPTFSENLRFFWRYQLNHMYFRYFMWNFAGRQNDIQGMADRKNGNWLTGITPFDRMRLGPVDDPPESLESKARNHFYLFPLLLGIIGLLFQYRKNRKDLVVVALLFLMTGIAIVLYLNQHSPQPRERDYAYAASFYAFSIWIGMGVAAVYDRLRNLLSEDLSAFAATCLCFLLVPLIMAKEGWDDHDRSGRYTALDMAANYLNSCAPNAILFTNGDNDTFPLWYAQEVEGIRTDVRVVNLSLLNTDWYINQMRRKVYESEPVPFSLPEEKYAEGVRNYTYLLENENVKGHLDVKELMDIIIHNESRLQLRTGYGMVDYFPSKKFKLKVDRETVLGNGTVAPGLEDEVVDEVRWTINRSAIGKNHLMVLDFLAANNWERPVYFAITTGSDAYIGLEDYFQLEGLTYRLVPVNAEGSEGQAGRVNTGIMYENVMNKFLFRNLDDPGVYLDETNMRMTMNLRNNFYRLSAALLRENRIDSARQVMDRCLEVMPNETIPYNFFINPIAEGYYHAGDTAKAREVAEDLLEIYAGELDYYFRFSGEKYRGETEQNLAMLRRIIQTTSEYGDTLMNEKALDIFDHYYDRYLNE